MGNVAQLVTIKNVGSPFFWNKKSAETPIFIVFFENSLFKKTNVAQLVTIKNPKRGPDNNSTAYIYI